MKLSSERLKERIQKNLINYVAVRSDTGSAQERNIEGFFRQWFDSIPYFRQNSEQCGFYKIPNDILGRSVSWCLVKGTGANTVVLMHHHDCVDTKEFGDLESVSLKPHELKEALVKRTASLPADAQQDLSSKDWMFGRGVNDMKGGGSIQLSLIEEYCDNNDALNGNILLISVPDEENLSAGMRGACSLLKELQDRFSLHYIQMINSEPHSREQWGTPVIHNGSIGKIMPVIHVQGKLAHVADVYNGLNPIRLLSEIVAQTEMNPYFLEKVGNTVSPPPVWLYEKDCKQVYDVSLPLHASGYMSILPLEKSPKEIMDKLREICTAAFQTVIDGIAASYLQTMQLKQAEPIPLELKPKVVFFKDLYDEAAQDSGAIFLDGYQSLLQTIKEKELSTIEAANTLIEFTLRHIHDKSPVVTIAIAPPFYPSVHNAMLKNEKSSNTQKAVDSLLEFAKAELDTLYTVESFFTGISDISYAMFTSDEDSIRYIEDNMLLWKSMYYIPLDIIRDLSMPAVNIGPWGKDLHKTTERVYLPDLYYNTPKLLHRFICTMLQMES